MKKDEFIAKYGEDAYELWKQQTRKWRKEHKEQYKLINRKWHEEHKEQSKQLHKNWSEEHKEQHKQLNKNWREEQRINGKTTFCTKNYEIIENYELAKIDNFDKTKWHLHHRLENYWSSTTLKRKGLYYGLNPEALIWLPANEHLMDRHKKNSKWHQRILEQGQKLL